MMRTSRKALLALSVIARMSSMGGAQAEGAVFTGTVVDSVQRPIPSAEVSLRGLGISKTTDDKGALRLTDIPARNQRISVRRVGFGQLDTIIAFVEGQMIERRVTLGRLTVLDQLDKMDGQSLATVLQQLQGVAVIRGAGGQGWVLTKRSPSTRCPTPRPGQNPTQTRANQQATDDCLRSERLFYVLDDFEARQGVTRTCYALVYLDRSLMNAGKPTTPFDVNTITTNQLQAIEWYESSGGVPAFYASQDSRCGMLILHTRRVP